ncbi:DUF4157 domain-containing protein [Streptomyces roseifaciens]|uniref:eCIS core domain-containing protein n=1 Tax=Streptomyces roseifaciens TaxID=1488406 RepID=UPI00071818A6|nr:DUF4157 domain-containing protein [Streptomyces roseifaciens]
MGGKELLSRTPDAPLRHTAPESAPARVLPRSPGTLLDHVTQRTMSARFSYDFSRVRTHSDEQAAELAAGLHARAYTVGHDVVFGRDMYAPHTATGQALLAHELGHVVEQSAAGVRAVQRDDVAAPAPVAAKPADPEAALGQRLVKEFPNGVALAFYQPMPVDNEEASKAAKRWAEPEKALAVKGKQITAANIVFGEAMKETDRPLGATVQAIGALLKAAVAKAPPDPAVPPGTGPATVRTLAVFAHGGPQGCGITSVNTTGAAALFKSIAPVLAPNINFILFSCNAGRTYEEKEDWVKGTMRPGGQGSLASVARDALIAEGKVGSVWAHTTLGHVSEGNLALREFDATTGSGSAGESFVTRYVFTPSDKLVATGELLGEVAEQGFVLGAGATAAADVLTEKVMYDCYAEACKKLNFEGRKLPDAIPTHPVEVGGLVRDYWTTYWPGFLAEAVKILIKRLTASGQATKRKQ